MKNKTGQTVDIKEVNVHELYPTKDGKFDTSKSDTDYVDTFLKSHNELKQHRMENKILTEEQLLQLKQLKRQYKIDQRYLRMAAIWSENSYCVRRQVGALLVKDSRIISDGYNGTPSGFPNVCEYIPYSAHAHSRDEIIEANNEGKEIHTHSYVLHAEANAITKIAKSNNSSDGATLYVTASPCMECSKLIIQSGIKRVVYSEEYRIMDGISLLQKAGVKCCFIKVDEEFEDSEFYKTVLGGGVYPNQNI